MSNPEGQLLLRRLAVSDASAMARWAVDPEFCRVAGWTMDLAPEDHLEFQRNVVLFPPTDLLRLGVELSGDLVGYVDLHGNEPGRRELGFLIGERRLWGRGIGRLAAAAALDHGFVVLGLQEIWAEAVEANVRSVAILRGLGFSPGGTGPDGEFMGVPGVYRRFTLSASDWATGGRNPLPTYDG